MFFFFGGGSEIVPRIYASRPFPHGSLVPTVPIPQKRKLVTSRRHRSQLAIGDGGVKGFASDIAPRACTFWDSSYILGFFGIGNCALPLDCILQRSTAKLAKAEQASTDGKLPIQHFCQLSDTLSRSIPQFFCQAGSSTRGRQVEIWASVVPAFWGVHVVWLNWVKFQRRSCLAVSMDRYDR